MITIRRIPNMLEATTRGVDRVPFKGDRLSHYLTNEELSGSMSVLISGWGEIKPEKYGELILSDGDDVVVHPRVGDPFSATAAALIVLASFGVPIGLIGYATIIAASVMSYMNARKSPKAVSQGGTLDDSPRYAWEGIQTVIGVDVPYPQVFGRDMTGGKIISQYVSTVENHSYYNALIYLSDGPVQAICGITLADYIATRSGTTSTGRVYTNSRWCNVAGLFNPDPDADPPVANGFVNPATQALCEAIGENLLINENPITDYIEGDEAPIIGMRFGTHNQIVLSGLTPEIPYFNEVHAYDSVNTRVLYNTPTEFTLKNDDTTHIRLVFRCPSLVEFHDSGPKKTRVTARIEYKLTDGGSYVDAPGSPYDTGKSKTNSQVMGQFEIIGLDPGNYTVRITKNTQDSSLEKQSDLYVDGIDEIKNEAYVYPYGALLSIRMKATGKINTQPNFAVLVDGTKVPVWTGAAFATQWSQNPIWYLYYLATDRMFGFADYVDQTALASLLSRYKDFAATCDNVAGGSTGSADVFGGPDSGTTEDRYQLDLTLDSQMAVPDLLNLVMSTCLGSMVYVNGAIAPFIERDDTPTQIFCMSNIKRDSFLQQSAPISQSFNVINSQYYDRKRRYKDTPLRVIDRDTRDTLDSGKALRDKSISLIGITRRSQATRVSAYLLRDSLLNVNNLAFKSGMDAVGCVSGDLVSVSHDVPQWGESGPVASATSTTVVLRRAVTLGALGAGESHTIKVQHAANDAIEERTVTDGAGDYAAGDTLNVTPAWTLIPSVGDNYTIGIINSKPFRVQRMTVDDQFEVALALKEFNVEALADTEEISDPPIYSSLPDPRRPPPVVENLTARNVGGYSHLIHVGYSLPKHVPGVGVDVGIVDHFEIWFSQDGENWAIAGMTNALDFDIEKTVPGRTYIIAVVTVSRFSKTALASSPQVTVVAMAGPPPDVTGLQLKDKPNEVIFQEPSPTFQWRRTSIQAGTMETIGSDTYGADSATDDESFDHFVFQVYAEGIVSPVFETTTKSNEYTYNIGDNRQANGGTAKRLISVGVYQVDKFGNPSVHTASMTVYNPPLPGIQASLLIGTDDELQPGDIVSHDYELITPPGVSHYPYIINGFYRLEFLFKTTGYGGSYQMTWYGYDQYIRSNFPDFDRYAIYRKVIMTGESDTPITFTANQPDPADIWGFVRDPNFWDIMPDNTDVDHVYYAIAALDTFEDDPKFLLQIKTGVNAASCSFDDLN